MIPVLFVSPLFQHSQSTSRIGILRRKRFAPARGGLRHGSPVLVPRRRRQRRRRHRNVLQRDDGPGHGQPRLAAGRDRAEEQGRGGRQQRE